MYQELQEYKGWQVNIFVQERKPSLLHDTTQKN